MLFRCPNANDLSFPIYWPEPNVNKKNVFAFHILSHSVAQSRPFDVVARRVRSRIEWKIERKLMNYDFDFDLIPFSTHHLAIPAVRTFSAIEFKGNICRLMDDDLFRFCCYNRMLLLLLLLFSNSVNRSRFIDSLRNQNCLDIRRRHGRTSQAWMKCADQRRKKRESERAMAIIHIPFGCFDVCNAQQINSLFVFGYWSHDLHAITMNGWDHEIRATETIYY